MASTQIDYQVRPNKGIERKLIFGALARLAKVIEYDAYSYIGFGSCWFVDFVMAHRWLGIETLISIERDPETAVRARANVPHTGVSVVEGQSTLLLPKALQARDAAVVWLDYNGGVDDTVLNDVQILGESAPAGSVVLITVNANPGKFGSEPERTATVSRLFPEAPRPLPAHFFQKPPDRFPLELARLIGDRLASIVASRIGHEYLPLFNFFYQDSTPMLTLGGMVIAKTQRPAILATNVTAALGATGTAQFVVDAPALTRREKLAFDRMLPEVPPVCDVATLQEAGLRPLVDPREAAYYDALFKRYSPVYKEYPTYSEFEL